MHRRFNLLRTMAVVALLLPGVHAPAQEAEAIVELPPFVVTEMPGRPWRYASVGGFEILTQGSDRETREVFAGLWRGRQMVLPASLLSRYSVPMTVVLFRQAAERATVMDSLGSVRGADEYTTHWTNLIKRTASERESFALNLWRSDFTYSVDFRFDTSTLMLRRTPAAPPWLKEGLFGRYGLYREGWFWRPGEEFRRVVPARWLSPEEAKQALRYYPRPGAKVKNITDAVDAELVQAELVGLIPELPTVFGVATGSGSKAVPGSGTTTATPGETTVVLPTMSVTSDFNERRASTTALFVRWALYGRTPADAEKFWRFAERACLEPVTPALFEEHFGMSFAVARFQLARYLPQALGEASSVPVGKVAPPPALELRRATADEIARVRGEWERLEALMLGTRFPEIAQRYREQAARRFKQAHDRGNRDPRLLASMGLLALDDKDPARARVFLEAAAGQRVAGPAVYFELARLRWLEAETAGANAMSAELIAGVVELLLLGERQSPALPALYGFLAEITLQTKNASLGQGAALRRGLEHFPRVPAVRTRLEAALKLVANQTQ